MLCVTIIASFLSPLTYPVMTISETQSFARFSLVRAFFTDGTKVFNETITIVPRGVGRTWDKVMTDDLISEMIIDSKLDEQTGEHLVIQIAQCSRSSRFQTRNMWKALERLPVNWIEIIPQILRMQPPAAYLILADLDQKPTNALTLMPRCHRQGVQIPVVHLEIPP